MKFTHRIPPSLNPPISCSIHAIAIEDKDSLTVRRQDPVPSWSPSFRLSSKMKSIVDV